MNKNKKKDFCMFALPGIFCFLAVVIVPFVYGIYLTLTDWNGVSNTKNFIGIQNFAGVFRDRLDQNEKYRSATYDAFHYDLSVPDTFPCFHGL